MHDQEVSRFQERVALFIGSGALLGMAVRKQRPYWAGVTLFAMGAILLRAGAGWLRSWGKDSLAPERPVERENRQGAHDHNDGQRAGAVPDGEVGRKREFWNKVRDEDREYQ